MTAIKEAVVGRIVHETPSFVVRIDEMEDPETGKALLVYGIVNKETGLREAELRGFTGAVAWTNKLQHDMNELIEVQRQEEFLFNSMPAYHEDRGDDADVPVDLLAKLDGE